MPTKLSKPQQELLRQLAELEDVDVLPTKKGFVVELKQLRGEHHNKDNADHKPPHKHSLRGRPIRRAPAATGPAGG